MLNRILVNSSYSLQIIIDRVALAKQGDNGIGSVRPSVCVCVCVCVCCAAKSNRSHYQSSGVRLCVCDQWAYAGNCADAVDRLLIITHLRPWMTDA